MRIWHYDLIRVLPNKQLKSFRYEIGDMIKQYPNIKNRLVNYANNYSIEFLFNIFIIILDEFNNRKINHNNKYDNNIIKIANSKSSSAFFNPKLRYKEHNERYLNQCYYNLQEKFDRRYDIKR